jgi:hypothetical protein
MSTPTQHPPHPVYIRMPRCGNACPYSSLSRSAIDLLVRPQPKNEFKPPVRSKIFRAEGKGKGIRLVEYASLMAYLGRLPITQNTEVATQ